MVLVALARQTDKRLRELALEVGISPRAAQSIVLTSVSGGSSSVTGSDDGTTTGPPGDRQLPDPWAQDRRIGELVRAIARGPFVATSL